ncbi:MAG: hypothetical protein HF981_19530 [Desulfobacteraceae bacterium]|nr:hypothetical protein [Desulfobacteraceae bacterium]MBC2752593.1 hypothetical protein [Desulfobacteraceae bacterium]
MYPFTYLDFAQNLGRPIGTIYSQNLTKVPDGRYSQCITGLGTFGDYEMWIFGQSGIIKSNLKAYFKARKKGHGVDQSLTWVVKSRYPDSLSDQSTIMEQYLELGEFRHSLNTEEEKVVALVQTIVEYEDPPPLRAMPDFEAEEKLKNEIAQTYRKMKKNSFK